MTLQLFDLNSSDITVDIGLPEEQFGPCGYQYSLSASDEALAPLPPPILEEFGIEVEDSMDSTQHSSYPLRFENNYNRNFTWTLYLFASTPEAPSSYTVVHGTAVSGGGDKVLSADIETCKFLCARETSFECLSFAYVISTGECQLS